MSREVLQIESWKFTNISALVREIESLLERSVYKLEVAVPVKDHQKLSSELEQFPARSQERIKLVQPDELRRGRTQRYRKPVSTLKYVSQSGTRTYPDGREVCTDREMRRRKEFLMDTLDPICGACDEEFQEGDVIELGHKESKGAGGYKRDDRMPNLFLIHQACNSDQGSMPLDEYRRIREKAQHV